MNGKFCGLFPAIFFSKTQVAKGTEPARIYISGLLISFSHASVNANGFVASCLVTFDDYSRNYLQM